MKTLKILTIALFLFLVMGCAKKGTTSRLLVGDEKDLPNELKGMKVYAVSTGDGYAVKVAILDNKVNSLTYQEGKIQQTTIVINPNTSNERIIKAKEILSETDEIIVIRK